MSELLETYQAMQRLVKEESKRISVEEFETVLRDHDKFLQNGGAGGQWRTYYIKNLIYGVYAGPTSVSEGKQAKLSFKKMAALDLRGIALPYADCASLHAPNQEWTAADLEGSLLIDSWLDNCSFESADLYAVDFSRSLMQNCNFRGASLIGVDFENCDLRGADFSEAQIDESTSFKNAMLENVKGLDL